MRGYLKRVEEALAGQMDHFNSMSRGQAEKLLHEIFSKHTKGVFTDAFWKPWQNLLKDLDDHSVDYAVNSSDYYTLKQSKTSEPDGKRWGMTIYAGDKGGWHVVVNASFGPSPISDPGSKYDMLYTISWDGKLRNP